MSRRRKLFSVPVPAGPAPIATINTTPLIDLMLVLLIMFILAIPMSTHNVPVDLPTDRPLDGPPPPVHRLAIDAGGGLWWDGRAIPDAALAPRLAAMAADPATPVLHIDTAPEARYERFDETLAAVRRAGIDRLGFVGNDRYAGALR